MFLVLRLRSGLHSQYLWSRPRCGRRRCACELVLCLLQIAGCSAERHGVLPDLVFLAAMHAHPPDTKNEGILERSRSADSQTLATVDKVWGLIGTSQSLDRGPESAPFRPKYARIQSQVPKSAEIRKSRSRSNLGRDPLTPANRPIAGQRSTNTAPGGAAAAAEPMGGFADPSGGFADDPMRGSAEPMRGSGGPWVAPPSPWVPDSGTHACNVFLSPSGRQIRTSQKIGAEAARE